MMRAALRPNPQRVPRARTISIKAPVKGWVATESLMDADLETAAQLDNFFPEPQTVRARRGRTLHASGIGDAVETLLPYSGSTAVSALFAAAGANIWDVTSDVTIDPVNDTPAVAGLANARWQHVMMGTAGGHYLFIVNGSDTPRHYDGSAWAAPAISGVTASTLVNVWEHKSRLWFAKLDSTDLYYLPTDSIAGAANVFPVGGFFNDGGYVMAGSTWSVDAGDGMDDLMVVISSNGEVLIYAGDDPAADFNLLGRYRTGDPIGRRCMFKMGGDLLIITELGLVPVSALLKLDIGATESKSLSRNIRRAYADAVQNARTAFGWQIVSFPIRNMGILNIPASAEDDIQQFVINSITGAWCRFTGIPALCWAHLHDNTSVTDNLYFGTADGKVYHGESGGDDDGTPITCISINSFGNLGMPGRLKHIKALRPITEGDVDQGPFVGIAVDYDVPQTGSAGPVTPGNWFTWDVSVWDGTDRWRGITVRRPWVGVEGIGTAIAPLLRIDISAAAVGSEFVFRHIGYDVIFEPGGVL
jgi:hypothetical protein